MVTKTTKLKKSLNKFQCRYCSKYYSTEKVLSNHLCVKKQRYNDRNTEAAIMGLRIYQKFYEKSMKHCSIPTVLDFVNSNQYLAFIKFSRYYIELRPINGNKFINYLLENGVSIDKWHEPEVYSRFLKDYLYTEPVVTALERTFIEIDKFSKEAKIDMSEYFIKINETTFVGEIMSGRISPWVFLLSNTGKRKIKSCDPDNIFKIDELVPFERWSLKLESKNNNEKVLLVEKALQMAGL